MNNVDDVVKADRGTRECLGRVNFSITWSAFDDGSSAEIALVNLNQTEEKIFKQKLDSPETFIAFHNQGDTVYISVWLQQNTHNTVELYLSYPVDKDTEFRAPIAEWPNNDHHHDDPTESTLAENAYINIESSEWEAIFPFFCINSLPQSKQTPANTQIHLKLLTKTTLYQRLTASPDTLKSIKLTEKVITDFIASSDFVSNFSTLKQPFSLLPTLLPAIASLEPSTTLKDITSLLASLPGGPYTLKQYVDNPLSTTVMDRLWSSLIAITLAAAKTNDFQCLLLDMVAALRVLSFLTKLYNELPLLSDADNENDLHAHDDDDENDHAVEYAEEDPLPAVLIDDSWFDLLSATVIIPDAFIPTPHDSTGCSTDSHIDSSTNINTDLTQASGHKTGNNNTQNNNLASEDSPGWCRFSGIGEIRVVYQKSKHYALGDIAHIINLIPGEKKSSSYASLESDLEEKIIEKENIDNRNSELSNNMTTQLSDEVKQVVSDDAKSLDASNLTPSYDNLGLVITGKSDTTNADTMSKAVLAQQYARDISDRAIESLKNKVADLRKQNHYTEIRKQFESTVDNQENKQAINAVYRWVDMVHHFEVRPSNRALIMEFMINSPANTFEQSLVDYHDIPLIKPIKVDLFDDPTNYTKITSENYREYQAQFGASILPEPPPTKIVLSCNQQNNGSTEVSGKLELPNGYTVGNGATAGKGSVRMVISDQKQLITGYAGKTNSISHSTTAAKKSLTTALTATGSTPVPPPATLPTPPTPAMYNDEFETGDSGEVSFSFVCHAAQFSVEAEIICEADTSATSVYPSLLSAWQQIVFRTLQSAYQQQIKDFNTAYALRLQQSSKGKTRRVERDSLKTSALDILTSSLGDSSPATLRFLDRIFLWDEMAYQFFPWQAGTRPKQQQWYGQKTTPESDDSLFDAFLNAGSCRMLVPLNPRLITEALFTLLFNQIWNDIPDNTITTEQGAAILNELSKPLDDINNKTRSWSRQVPTTHVYLQEGNQLPWIKRHTKNKTRS